MLSLAEQNIPAILTGLLLIVTIIIYRRSLRNKSTKLSSDPPLSVVITGSTRGIGKALSKEFLKRGDNVIISGRDKVNVEETKEELRKSFPNSKVFGLACDITINKDVEDLARFAQNKLGRIDVWINNAGITHTNKHPLVECSDEELRAVVDTNLLGTLFGCRESLKAIMNQKPSKEGSVNVGHIFIMDGSGTRGNATANYIAYGATKACYPQLMKTLVSETSTLLKDRNAADPNNRTFIGIHRLSPGMVITDLLLSGNKEPRILKLFNILAEHPDTVAKFLVSKIKGISGSGSQIAYLTPLGVVWRFLTFFMRRNRFFDAQGNIKESVGVHLKSQ